MLTTNLPPALRRRRVQRDDSGLVRLGDVRKHAVDRPTSMRYLSGWRASSIIGMTFVRCLAMLIKSRPGRCENSTAYTQPCGPDEVRHVG